MIRPFMDKVPESERATFVDMWIDRYLKDNPDAIGRSEAGQMVLSLLDRNWLVTARKVAELE
jgi:hypothetical protein